MEKLVEQGLCKAIGISNFTVKKTNTLLETAKIVPACNQGRIQKAYPSFKNIKVYSPSLGHKPPLHTFRQKISVITRNESRRKIYNINRSFDDTKKRDYVSEM